MTTNQSTLNITESRHFRIYNIHIQLIMAPFNKGMIHSPNVPVTSVPVTNVINASDKDETALLTRW